VRADFPESGAILGLEGVRDYMRRFLANFERTTFDAENFRVVGDTVLVRLVQRGTVRGIESELRFFILFTFRGGKIVRMEAVRHERDALEALGLRE
jgi:ketosteroid isomerase-like protein